MNFLKLELFFHHEKEDEMEFLDVIKERYSVRKFDSRPVEEDKINVILETARLAPTAVNKQSERLLVLQSQEAMAKLAKCTKYTFHAPMAIIVCADESTAWIRPNDNENAAIIDGAIVGTYIMLTVCNLGLGTCWVGHFDPAQIKAQFKLPEHTIPVAVFPIGYLAADCTPASRHYERHPLAELVRYNSF